jgi:hypothetical protein
MAGKLGALTIAAPGFYGLNTQDSGITISNGFALEATNCIIDKFGRIGSRKGWTTYSNTDAGVTGAVRAIKEHTETDGTLTVLFAANNKLWKLDGSNNPVELTALSATITAATQADPCSITATAHGFNTGDSVTITGVVGMTELNDNSYTITVVDADTFTLDSTDSTAFTAYTSGGTATRDGITVTDDDWQIVSYNNKSLFIQAGHTMVYYDGTSDSYLELANPPSATQPTCGASCFNRAWVAKDYTVYWSKILEPHTFTGTGSGFINMREIFGEDDNVVAITSYNNRLVIFGRRNIAFFAGAEDPTGTTFQLTDHIKGIGCIARDSVQNVGTDVVFLSSEGVRSVGRVIQEQSSPIGDVSKNVRDELVAYADSESQYRIKAVYSPLDAFYLLTMPTTGRTYCFDMRTKLEDGSRRVTIWDSIDPKSFAVLNDNTLLIGQTAYVGKYDTNLDNTETYRMVYYTNYLDLGNSVTESILKKVRLAILGSGQQSGLLKWAFDYNSVYRNTTFSLADDGASEYNVDEYFSDDDVDNEAEYSSGLILGNLSLHTGGRGAVLQLGVEIEINGGPISVQKMDIFAKQGKLIS